MLFAVWYVPKLHRMWRFFSNKAIGWCGDTDGYCLVTNGCNAGFGVCTGAQVTTTTPPPATTTPATTTSTATPLPTIAPIDGSCGVGGGGAICSAGQCCSPSGWCGSTSDYCTSPGCQLDFGTCDAEYVSSAVFIKCGRKLTIPFN